MLRVRQLSAGYGHAIVLSDVDMDVDANSIVAVIGANGAGKSTLLAAVSGLLPMREGMVEFHGHRLDGLRSEQIARRGLAHVPEGRRLFAGLSVRDNLLLGGWRLPAPELDPVLELFPPLAGRLGQLAGSLSGGEQQMCAIARGLVGRPALLMIDEMSLGLAPNVVEDLLQRLPDIAAAGTSVLLVEQDVGAALPVAEYAYVLDDGRVSLHGTAGRLLANPAIREAYLGI